MCSQRTELALRSNNPDLSRRSRIFIDLDQVRLRIAGVLADALPPPARQGGPHTAVLATTGASSRCGGSDLRIPYPTGVVLLLTGVWSSTVAAQPPEPPSNTTLSKEAENPVTRMVTLPLRYEAEFDNGPYQSTKDTFEIDQAVFPFLLNDDWALITRTKFPAILQPPKKLGEHWASGLSNGYTTFFLSPEHEDGFYWGAGPVIYYPSATNQALGVNKWGSGPSVAFLKKDQSPWVWGTVVNNIWSFGGPPGGSDRTNSLLLNPFISYHFGDGWSVGSSPNIAANWLAKAGQQWTIPVGGGVSKLFRLGGQPVKLSVDSYYNAVRAQSDHNTWIMQVTITFLFSQ